MIPTGITVKVGVIINMLMPTAELPTRGLTGKPVTIERIRLHALPNTNTEHAEVAKDAGRQDARLASLNINPHPPRTLERQSLKAKVRRVFQYEQRVAQGGYQHLCLLHIEVFWRQEVESARLTIHGILTRQVNLLQQIQSKPSVPRIA